MRILLIFAFCLFSCNQQKKNANDYKLVLDHFGSLKIGMERNHFQSMFKSCSKIKDDGYKIGYNIVKFQFNESIVLDTVYAEFEKDRLVYVGTSCNDKLITYLKNKFHFKINTSFGETLDTNSEETECGIEKLENHCAVGLYKIGWYSSSY